MGTRHTQRDVSDSPFSTRRTINGGVNQSEVEGHRLIALIPAIVLHIEKTATESPYELIFSRANTDVVHIGRLSSSEVEQWHGGTSSALFKCAVVSRSHAKVVFSDSGHVVTSSYWACSFTNCLVGLPHRLELTPWHTSPQARRDCFQDVDTRDTDPTR
jgi:hypothetical protein